MGQTAPRHVLRELLVGCNSFLERGDVGGGRRAVKVPAEQAIEFSVRRHYEASLFANCFSMHACSTLRILCNITETPSADMPSCSAIAPIFAFSP